MQNEITVYISGDEMCIEQLLKTPLLEKSKILCTREGTGEMDLRFKNFTDRKRCDMIKKKFIVDNGIEKKMWDLNRAFKKMEPMLMFSNVELITFLICVHNDEDIEFGIEPKMFEIHDRIKVEIKCTVVFPNNSDGD